MISILEAYRRRTCAGSKRLQGSGRNHITVLDRWLGQDPVGTDAMLGAAYPRLGFL
jgi:hypothetical protein